MSTLDLVPCDGAASHWLTSVVACADDAIISIDQQGNLASWNQAAQRLLGYSEAEALGASIAMISDDDADTLDQLQRDGRLPIRELIYRHKDGGIQAVAVTTSAIFGDGHCIIGAALIARKIATPAPAPQSSTLLIADMHHRIRNLFTLAAGVVALSARFAETPADLARRVRGRLVALSRANDLSLPSALRPRGARNQPVKLHSLLDAIVSSYGEPASTDGRKRVVITGVDPTLTGGSVTHIALLVNELATNAAKYGALSQADGMIHVACSAALLHLRIIWSESGGPPLEERERTEGFGSQFCRAVISRQLGGAMTRTWRHEGLIVQLTIPLANLKR